jgi:multidrug efflux pump
LLQPHGARRDAFARIIERLFGWFFRPFNRFFETSAGLYVRGVAQLVRRSGVALFVYAGLIGLTYYGFKQVPTGFVPTQDKQYLVAFAQLPDAASLDRTEEVIRRMSDLALKHPGVEASIAFPGL